MGKILLAILIFTLSITNTSFSQVKTPEFRAAWVATVTNIDWPSNKNLSTEEQKASFIKLIDYHKSVGLNAMIVQIRPSADAFYPSPYEPWSEWLTGKQGIPPYPFYDPLQFMIEEAHKRGMQFHAWMNPYRAVFNNARSSLTPFHITKLHPDWFVTYGDIKYFDPGNEKVMDYVTAIVRDVVRRYKVDGIHFDDYFYPYRIAGKEFPDAVSYSNSGTTLRKDDWRRSNTDTIISRLYKAIKEEDKYCQFGISPFGVWRNIANDADGSNTNAGQTNYDDLYADVLLWMKKGWIDYVTPQLYWEFGHKAAAFETLVEWWSRHTYGVNCYIGLGLYRANTNVAWRDKTQLPRQIKAIRSYSNLNGVVLYSSKFVQSNPNGWSDSLKNNYFNTPVPAPMQRPTEVSFNAR
jgi:uncharacterized lipoprotein YddW (UPF0748 family)